MNRAASQASLEQLRSKETSELVELLKTKAARLDTSSKAAPEAGDVHLEAITEVLSLRQARFPDPSQSNPIPHRPVNTRPLATDSNASVGDVDEDKLELHFPKEGFLRCGKSHFKNQDELQSHLSEALGIRRRSGSLRFKFKRKGKYVRIDSAGSPVFTFGDPVLDMITDENGWLSVGRETHNLLRLHLTTSHGGRGGIANIDLALAHQDLQRQQLAEALSPNGKYALLEYTANRVITAATNPSSLDFTHGTARMRFRSWKHNYGIYRSIGSEIETWGKDFSSASIRSTYADPVVSANPFVCAIVKTDSDSDTNDDYVDEYEWAVNGPLPSTVRSYCQARWFGQAFAGSVSKGDCATFL